MDAGFRDKLRTRVLQDCHYYSLTTDIWADRSARSFIALTIRYVDYEIRLHDWVLEVKSLPDKRGANEVDAGSLGLGKCTMLVRDGGSNTLKAPGLQDRSHVVHRPSIHLVVGRALTWKASKFRVPASAQNATGASLVRGANASDTSTRSDADGSSVANTINCPIANPGRSC